MKRIYFILLFIPYVVHAQSTPAGQGPTTYVTADTIRQILVVNLMGQRVFDKTYNQERVLVDIADLPSGIYIVKINGRIYGRYNSKGEIHFTATHPH
jgi:Secretion system C-terminal sorting domain